MTAMATATAAAAAAVEFLQQLLELGALGRVSGRHQRTRLGLVRRPEFGEHGREQIEGSQIVVAAEELRPMSDETRIGEITGH